MAQTSIGGTKPPVEQERALPEEYKSSIIESRYVPQTSLLSMVPGTPTRTLYYRQYLGASEEQIGFQPESIETYQSYTRVNDLILKIDNGNGNYNFVPDTGVGTHQLTGYILFDLTPNKGDLFIKDIGGGKAGLYTITEQPELRTIQADKVYYFEATLEAVMTQSIQNNLDIKTVKTLWYSKDSAVAGGNAVLTENDHELNKKLYDAKFAIMDDLLSRHYYNAEDTVIIPNALDDRLYDPYLAKFLSYVLPANEIAPRNKIRTLSVQYWVDGTRMQEPMTVWDMFYRNDFAHPERYRNDFYVHYRSSLMNTRFYGGIFFSKMDRCITVHKDGSQLAPYQFSGALIPSPTAATPRRPIEGELWDYFFGNDFYLGNGTPTQQFIWRMFRDKIVDKKGLLEVLDGYWILDDTSKLYMGGIYLLAIRQALVTTSDYT
ncbi:hypothetical protein AH04_119 [Erwinia phage AH04]|uniref:Virion structural protein n=1 Tax=Erwinia phage AH04 TaxID=2869569 RepID=A0AAE7X0W2_9CAUD|nr:virion structural protein [Erwinia phage AH04]QZA70775.1 hypothetical protein AH04_119 [Erwinia phage AH04]